MPIQRRRCQHTSRIYLSSAITMYCFSVLFRVKALFGIIIRLKYGYSAGFSHLSPISCDINTLFSICQAMYVICLRHNPLNKYKTLTYTIEMSGFHDNNTNTYHPINKYLSFNVNHDSRYAELVHLTVYICYTYAIQF